MEQEESDPVASIDHSAQAQADELTGTGDPEDPSDGLEIGDERTGRLLADDQDDDLAQDVGIDGAAASAEEAAVHTVDEDEI
jgi:hypothetical protein